MSLIIPLTKKESEIRKLFISDKNSDYLVIYDLFLSFRKISNKKNNENNDFDGYLNLTFTYYPKTNKKADFFIDFIGKIHSLKINSTNIQEINYKCNRLILDLSLLKYGKNEITILFSGNYDYNGKGLNHYIDPINNKEYLYTQFQPSECQRLFPCFDQPDIKGILKLKVLSPKDWKIIFNTLDKSKIDINDKKYKIFDFPEEWMNYIFGRYNIKDEEYRITIFEETPKLSTYLYALCLGSYYCIENKKTYPICMRIFIRESLKDYVYAEEIFKTIMEGIKWYSNYFYYDFPSNKYDHVFCPDYTYGAMENFGLVTINEEFCFKNKPSSTNIIKRDITILHELAHMWFGNLTTMKWWDDLWLNESFATFISYLCASKLKELDENYHSLVWITFNKEKELAITADGYDDTHPIRNQIKDTSELEEQFDDVLYKKGSCIIKQIYYYLGDKNFSIGLAKYFNEFKYKNVEYEDFLNIMTNISECKFKDLRELCFNWIQKEGANIISLDLEIEETTKKISKFTVRQKPILDKYPFMMTHFTDFLFVYDFEDNSKNKVFKKVKIEPKNETVFDFSKELEPKLIFLNYNDYGYFKIDISYANLINLKIFLTKCKDLLLKSSLISSLYNTFIDKKINSIEFLNIILPVIEIEENVTILSNILNNVISVIEIYLPLKYIKK